jgi:imidazolonepropionase-like amidohydrolase
MMIAALNGATYLWRQSRIGPVKTGEDADVMIVRSDPFTYSTGMEHVEVVIKGGTA